MDKATKSWGILPPLFLWMGAVSIVLNVIDYDPIEARFAFPVAFGCIIMAVFLFQHPEIFYSPD